MAQSWYYSKKMWLYDHMLQKEDSYWTKKCMEYEVEGAR